MIPVNFFPFRPNFHFGAKEEINVRVLRKRKFEKTNRKNFGLPAWATIRLSLIVLNEDSNDAKNKGPGGCSYPR